MDILRPLSSLSFSLSPRFESFPDSNNGLLSDSKRPRNKIPSSLKTWLIVTTIITMVTLAVAIEVTLYFSNKMGGFPTGHVDTEQVQWWSGFLPTLAIGPLVWIWKRVDNDFKKMQPYVNMSQGPAKAETSVLLDLEHGSLFDVLSVAFKNGQFLILGSSVICIANILLHPMAGSLFLVKPGITTNPSSVENTALIGLNPSYKDISSFVAAAGFAEAAAFHNLSDPPFIQDNWAVAQFKFPLDVTRNSTISVSTTAVQTNVTCSVPTTTSLTPPTSSAPRNWTLSASLAGGSCTFIQSIDSSAALTQYGVEPVLGCTRGANSNQNNNPFSPVFFWFYNNQNGGGTPVVSAVFCVPTIGAYAVEVAVDGATGLLVGVNMTGNVDGNSNNVTGGDFAGKAFNGVSFDSSSDFNLTDPFVEARALAVTSGVPGAIFRVASDPNQAGGLDAVFSNTTGFLGLTEKIYTQYLSLVALANYFVPAESSLKAVLTLWPNRLWINPRSAHFLAALLVLVAVAGSVLHIIHRRKRKRLYLASRPGSMAHYMSLLSQAQLASLMSSRDDAANRTEDSALVGPLDDEQTMEEKLEGVRFMLDERTGSVVAILPDQSVMRNRSRASKSRRAGSSSHGHEAGYELEDPRKSLLAQGFRTEEYSDPFDRKDGGQGHA